MTTKGWTGFQRKTEAKRTAIIGFIDRFHKVTQRQIFYYLVTKGLIDNTLMKYNKLVPLVNRMRIFGLIPFNSILDRTGLYGTTQYDNIEEPIENAIKRFRGNWNGNFPEYIEVWLEKQALRDIVYQVTNAYGVALSVASGTTKLSQIQSFINRINYYEKPTIILYLGDFDPTGLNIDKQLLDQMKSTKLQIHALPTIKRIALTEQQTKTLPKSFQKAKEEDPNYKAYIAQYGETVWELDALDPKQLQDIIRDEIQLYRPISEIEKLRVLDEKAKEEAKLTFFRFFNQ